MHAFSVEDREKESPALLAIIDFNIEKNEEFLNSLHMNRKIIYDAVYGSETSDNENLQIISDRLHEKNDDIGARTDTTKRTFTQT